MLCPLKHETYTYPSGSEEASFGDCEKDKCAWWVDSHGEAKCAIKASALANIVIAQSGGR